MTALAALPPLRTTVGRLCSVLVVDRIEPNLDFWVGRLGFEVRLQVWGEHRLGFAVLVRGDLNIMFRTRDFLREETSDPVDSDRHRPWVVQYLQVDELDEILDRLPGVELVLSKSETIPGDPLGRILALSSR